MAIKIFVVLMCFFSLTLVFLSLQDFYFIDIKPYGVDFKNVEARRLDAFELNSTLVKANYTAEKWERYKDKDVFNAVFVYGYDFNLSANELISMDKNLTLNGNVRYTDINATSFETQRLFYDGVKKVVSSKSAFKAARKDSNISGKAFSYDTKSGELKIQGVKAWLETR